MGAETANVHLGSRSAVARVIRDAGKRRMRGIHDTVKSLVRATLKDFWTGLGELVRFADVVEGNVTVPELREATYLTSAGVLYAIAFAVHTVTDDGKISVTDAVRALDSVDFDRTAKTTDIKPQDTLFSGNLIDPDTGKLVAGRTAWESAAALLVAEITGALTDKGMIPTQPTAEAPATA